jgi:single-strand DNA-binding protein
VNVVILIGNLATEVDVRDLGEDRARANFLLAVDRRSSSGGADFVDVTTWDKQAEVCGRYLSKGKRVGVVGRLRSSSWEDAEGKRRRATEVVAHSVEFLSPPDGAGAAEDTPFADVVPLSERSMT